MGENDGGDPLYRARQPRPVSIRVRPFERDFTDEQLTAIGRVVIYFNYLEQSLDTLLTHSIGVPPTLADDLTSRINGAEGKVTIIKKAIAELPLPNGAREFIAASLGNDGFLKLKVYRDKVTHATLLDQRDSVGLSRKKHGKRDEIYLSVEALNGVSERMRHLRIEIQKAAHVCRLAHIVSRHHQGPRDDIGRVQEQQQSAMEMARQARSLRDACPSLPRLPAAPPVAHLADEGGIGQEPADQIE